MSQYNRGGDKGFLAGAAIADATLVKLSANQTVVNATAATDVIIGVAMQTVLAGQVENNVTIDVRLRNAQGTSLVKLGGTVAVNDKLTATAGGVAVTTSTAGNEVFGYALEAGVTGDIIEVLNTVIKVY